MNCNPKTSKQSISFSLSPADLISQYSSNSMSSKLRRSSSSSSSSSLFMLPIISLRNLGRAYKNVLRKWFRCNRPSLSPRDINVGKGRPEGITRGLTGIGNLEDEVRSPRVLFRVNCFPCLLSSPSESAIGKRRAAMASSPLSKSESKRRDGERESSDPVQPAPSTPRIAGESRKSRRTLMYSNSFGMLKPAPIELDLECSLEDLCFGSNKNINFTRQIPSILGQKEEEEDVLKINVMPGWTKGTTIKFEDKRGDVICTISEKNHQLFRRAGDDLELVPEISLIQALTGFTISVPLLGGDYMDLTVEDEEIVKHGYEKIIEGQGMPISQEPEKRGNLRIVFLVEFPTQLTQDQRSEVASILLDSC